MRTTVHVAAVLVLAAAGSGSPTAFWDSPKDSSLTIILAEAPGDTKTPVTVTGPDDYRIDVAKTTVLRNLGPGRYTATPAAIPNPLGTVTPEPASRTVDLGRNDHEAMSFRYLLDAPPLSPRGDPADFAIQSGSATDPTRWNPCRTITWGPVLPLPAEEEQRLTQAFAKASIASGIPFRRTLPGETPQVAVNLTFAPGDRVEGEGEMFYRSTSSVGRQSAYRGEISGVVGNSTSAELREALYLHEIGHVLGVTHVTSDNEVMHEVVDEADAAGYAAGDTTGLQLVGASSGCLDPPLGAKEVKGTLKEGTLTVTWFQPASDPPVVGTVLRLTTRNASGRASGEPQWANSFTGAGAGPMTASATVPANVCDSGVAVTIAATNSHGTTETPVVLSGCPGR